MQTKVIKIMSRNKPIVNYLSVIQNLMLKNELIKIVYPLCYTEYAIELCRMMKFYGFVEHEKKYGFIPDNRDGKIPVMSVTFFREMEHIDNIITE